MMTRMRGPLGLLVLLTVSPAIAGTKNFQLRDHLNREWTDEYVSYELTFANRQCHEESMRLAGADGRAVPHQLSGIEFWPESLFVKRATLSSVVGKLPALGEITYTLTFGPASAPAVALTTDLKVAETEGGWELATSAFGVRVLRGGATFEEAQPIAQVPAPVAALRLADGTWFGQASFDGPARVAEWRSELVADGPVFAEVRMVYKLADGNELSYSVRLVQGDYAARFVSHSTGDMADTVLGIDLSRGVGVRDAVLIPGLGRYAKEMVTALAPKKTGPLFYLNCWPGDGWFKDSPAALRIRLAGRDDELQISVVDAGAWSEAETRPKWASFQPWDYENIPEMWHGWQSKRIPFVNGPDAGLVMNVDGAPGWRKWMLGATKHPDRLLKRFEGTHMSVHSPLPRLNEVKDMVLAWKSGRKQHPWLMVNGQRELERAAVYDQSAFTVGTDIDSLRLQLDTLGRFDPMRAPKPLAYLYDGCYEAIDPSERDLFKAQMAYVGYLLRNPLFWAFERGANSGNPNMTVSRTVNVGLIGCVLLDHPEGKVWAQYAIDWIKYWLENTTDEQGV